MFDLQSSSSVEEICTAGEKILVNLYNGKPEESSNSLRYKQFCEKVASNTSHKLIPEVYIPPTAVQQNVTVYLFSFRFTNGRVLQ